jgi:dihydroflavonol-4-reductase
MSDNVVLVTGGSGFVAVHCIAQLLDAGYQVRTTVRSLARETDVRAMLATAGVPADQALSFTQADLMSDAGWPVAVAGCTFVLHVASPFPPGVPKHEDELIVPARDGALRVLRASRDAGIKRVVLTSSFAAIGSGHKQMDRPFTEQTWTDSSARSHRLCEIEDARGTCGLAVRVRRGWRAGTVGRESRRRLGPVLGPDLPRPSRSCSA